MPRPSRDARISIPPSGKLFYKALFIKIHSSYLLNLARATMVQRSFWCSLLLSLALLPFSWALKFDLAAHMGHNSKYERCIRNFVAKDTLVLVTAIVDGQKGDGQMVNMHVSLCKA